MTNDLKDQIAAILKEAEVERTARQQARHEEMRAREERGRQIEGQIRKWMEAAILPRLQQLSQAMPAAGSPAWDGTSGAASLVIKRTEAFPVDAEISVSIAPDPEIHHLYATFRVSILPILDDYHRESRMQLEVERPDEAALGRFLDEGVLRFARDYARMLRPASPYQKERLVVDPVCGMTIPVSEAVGSVLHRGAVFHFCVEECRRKFEGEPGRFAR